MEPPSNNDFAKLYRKLLPSETQSKVLLNLPTHKLLAMCKIDSAIFDSNQPQVTEGICDDYVFWKAKLEKDGIYLLENFDSFIDQIKAPSQSRASFIQRGLYYNPKTIRSHLDEIMKELWELLINIVHSEDFTKISFFDQLRSSILAQLEAKLKEAKQLCLDCEFYRLQMENWRARTIGNPRIIILPISTLPSERIDRWEEYKELIKEGDFNELGDIGYLPDFRQFEDRDIQIPAEVFNSAEEFDQELLGNELDTYDLILKEGDLITYGSGNLDNIHFYVTEIDNQFLLTEILHDYLPEVAIPFLIRKKVQTYEDLRELYRGTLNGFVWQGKRYNLADKSEPYAELKIHDHVFHILKPREPKVPSAPSKVKRQPLTRQRPIVQPKFDQD